MRHGGVEFHLHPKNRHAGAEFCGGDGGTRAKPATADRDHQGFDSRRIFQHFKRRGALASDHGRVVIGVDEDQALGRCQRMGMGGCFGKRRAVQHNPRPPGFRAGYLGGRREFRHDDGGGDAGKGSVPRHGLGVIAGGHGDDPGGPFAGGEQRQPIGRAPFLEGPGGLQVIEFQEDPGPGRARNRLAFECWGAQHGARNAPRGGPDIGQGNGAAFGQRRAHRHGTGLI